MEIFQAIFAWLWIWFIHAVVAAVLTAPIVFLSYRRVAWQKWELLAFVLPFGTWTALMFSELSTGTKSMSNLLEPFCLPPAIAVAALVRAILGNRVSERICAVVLITALCLLAVAVFFVVPPLPEQGRC